MRKAVKPAEKAVPVVANTRPGTVLHLGDGRKLAFGETAEVSPEVAALINERTSR